MIFVHDRVYYALPHGIGELNWSKLNAEYLQAILDRLIKAKTVKGVMNQIDVKFPQNDVATEMDQNRTVTGSEACVKTNLKTKSSSKQCINGLKDAKVQTEVEEYRGYTIYKYENTFFARPKSSAKVDFAVDDFFSRSDVLYDVSITGLREVINSKEI